jgi:hypothetical protein
MKNLIILILIILPLGSMFAQSNDTVYCFTETEIGKITEVFISKDTLESEVKSLNETIRVKEMLYNNCDKERNILHLQIENYEKKDKLSTELILNIEKDREAIKDSNKKLRDIVKSSVVLNVVLIILLVL